MSNFYGDGETTSDEVEPIDSDEEDQKRSSRDPDKSPFSVIWRDDLNNDKVRIPCSTLLIALGSTASAFTFSHVLCNYEMELIGYATGDKISATGEENSERKPFDQIKKQQFATQNLDRIYRLPSTSFVIVQLTSSLQSDRLWPVTEQILNKFDLSNLNTNNPVYILQSRSAMDYVTIEGELESKANLFVRYIKSTNIPTEEKISQTVKPMEPPNAIRGLAAALFTKLQLANIPVLVLVVFQRHPSISVDALKVLQRILDRLSPSLKEYIQITEKTSKQLTRLASVQLSNMYS